MPHWFSRKKKNRKEIELNRVENRFQTVVDLVRDLDEEELSRLLKGVKLCWQGYREVEQAKSAEEKEFGDIDMVEEVLEKEDGRN